MTTSLATFIGYARQDLRDETATPAFSDDELTDLIIAGITELGQFYPKEVISTVTLVADTLNYPLPSDIKQVFRVERYNSDGTFLGDIPESPNDQRAGWQVHADTLFLPSAYTAGDTLKLWGYGPWSNFGWPSDDTGGWWASGSPGIDEYYDPGIVLAAVRSGDTFVAWTGDTPWTVGATCTAEQIGASGMYRLTFTEDGTNVAIQGGGEDPYIVLHKVSAMPFIGE